VKINLSRNYIHDNGYQGVFIEQGSQYSVVSDNELARNGQGIAFYNNNFAQLVTDHAILANTIYGSDRSGIAIGSTSLAGAFYPSVNSYIIGNTLYENALTSSLAPTPGTFTGSASAYKRRGIDSNGAAYGFFIASNRFPTKIVITYRKTLNNIS